MNEKIPSTFKRRHAVELGIVKDERFSKKGFVVALSPLIFNNGKKLEHMKNVAENCDKEVNNCQLGNEITACVYKYAPELHFKS
ncbi:unnamed protein product [Leptosia nina]|uniref:Uncharacterized protein n=1 Tax=Leptosia nina TaxID=320188 RepID=A0AAV1J129_9NEOP